MKLAIQLAGLCASGTFIVTALPGFYQQVKPTNIASMATDAIPGMSILENLAISLVGAALAAFLGYVIGDILSNPKGPPKKQKKAPLPAQGYPLPAEPVAAASPPMPEPGPVYAEEAPPPPAINSDSADPAPS